jgi:hypothetical protein
MIDPLQISGMVKTMDFLFDEGHKILQERRERRQKDGVTSSIQDKNSLAKDEILDQPDPAAKQKLLSKKIDPNIWNANEQHVQHLMKLIEINIKKYYLAREQYTKWGDALVPAIIVNNLEEAEKGIWENAGKLKEVLADVYGKRLT